jgi:hypothetical protein
MAWRAVEIVFPDGVFAVDVTGSGRLTTYSITVQANGVRREVGSADELLRHLSGVTAADLAALDPVGFAFAVCVLYGRPQRVLTPHTGLWADLEKHFGLTADANPPKIAEGRLIFLTSPQYAPELRVNRLTVDLQTLRVTEEPLVRAPWPPVSAGQPAAT